MTKAGSRPLSLFDIRLNSCQDGVLVLKGSADEASSILLSGTIVLSILEPLHVKQLRLGLYGTLRMDFEVAHDTPKGTVMKPVGYDRNVYEHIWDNIDVNSPQANQEFPGMADRSRSSPSLPKQRGKLTASRSLMNIHTTSRSTRVLAEGNYEFPFSAVLPPTLTESVEGLPEASITYKLIARLERGKLNNDYICRKHIRVVRTMTPTSVELSETVAVANTWPGKLDYSLSIPSRAVAIGTNVPLDMILVPYVKGLKLGTVKASIVENLTFATPYGGSKAEERTVSKIKLSDPLGHLSGEPDSHAEDRWDLSMTIAVPPSLSKCCQDCTILNNIKVRHKVKLVISLVNPESHISELRATLPIQLFISPYVTVGVKSSVKPSINTASENDEEDTLFANVKASEDDLDPVSQPPPDYASHIYDRLWSGIPIRDTPVISPALTPSVVAAPSQSLNMEDLQEGLEQLQMQQVSGCCSPGCGSVTAQLHEAPKPLAALGSDHDPGVQRVQNGMASPDMASSPRVHHISAVTSSEDVGAVPSSAWELNSMSKVPSYKKLVWSELSGSELPPAYFNVQDVLKTSDLRRPAHHIHSSSTKVTTGHHTKSKPLYLRSISSSILHHKSHTSSHSRPNSIQAAEPHHRPQLKKGKSVSTILDYFSGDHKK
ncbi:ADR172Cp [Eremothecium gossypii ATCC 10895]|uniref:ADR172Cp n=1 Tax=Eremothecium gossypii (strain ATCC 10895 / CBS 109.51 / FGSC 9923 / NRRL Y-1056) TaxID=284811 RepID=Q759V0_EREGS|nr:ADR172Cp [Eremothecium gossypii ATCC 10895]AAS52093.1 ADR172Cp [Eremothecium gossypii ATCC 10895]